MVFLLGLRILTTLSRERGVLKKCGTPKRKGSPDLPHFSSPSFSLCVLDSGQALLLCAQIWPPSYPDCGTTGLEGQIVAYLSSGDTPAFAFAREVRAC